MIAGDPRNPALLPVRAAALQDMKQPEVTAAAYRAALEAAEANRGEYVGCICM